MLLSTVLIFEYNYTREVEVFFMSKRIWPHLHILQHIHWSLQQHGSWAECCHWSGQEPGQANHAFEASTFGDSWNDDLHHWLTAKVTCNLLFGIIELLGGKDESGDVLLETWLGLGHWFFSHFLLLLVVIEDGRHVLSGAQGGGVMVGPEYVQEVASRSHSTNVILISQWGWLPVAG